MEFSNISKLITKYLKNEIGEKEMSILEDWLNEDSRNRELLDFFKHTTEVQKELDLIKSINVDRDWELLEAKHAKRQKLTPANYLKYAIAAVVIIALGVFFYPTKQNDVKVAKQTVEDKSSSYDIQPGKLIATLQKADGSKVNLGSTRTKFLETDGTLIDVANGELTYKRSYQDQSTENFNVLTTPAAGYYHLTLVDGTKVWLNALSSLKFPLSFPDNERVVELTGEGYFEVAPNKNKPFKVKFNNSLVEVLGTHFNINTYYPTSKTTLLEGSVAISNNSKRSLLKPGEQATVNPTNISVAKVDTYKAMAWKEGVFYFDNDDMKEITDQVARWYGVEVVYENGIPKKKITGSIRRQATLKQVMEMLKTVSGANFSLKQKTLTVN